MKNNQKGAAVLLVVMGVIMMMSLIIASLLSLIDLQRKTDVKKELIAKANSAAESAVDYAYSYIINDINKNTVLHSSLVPTAGYISFAFTAAQQAFLTGTVVPPAGYTKPISPITYSNLDVRILSPATIPGTNPASTYQTYYVDGNDPANYGDANKNQWVGRRLIPIVAKITVSQGGQQYTAYVEKDIEAREVYLFQYAIFFQGQLHMHRGYHVMGPIHTNGMLFLNAQNGDSGIYNGAISCSRRFYRGSTFDQGGTGSDPFGYVPTDANGDADWVQAKIVNPPGTRSPTGTTGQIQIYTITDKTGTPQYAILDNFDSDSTNWYPTAGTRFSNNLLDYSYNVPVINPIGTAGYTQDVRATTDVNEFNNAPYKLLVPTLPDSYNSDTSTTPGPRLSDLSNNLEANASLVLMVECIDPTSITPGATTSIMLHKLTGGDYSTDAITGQTGTRIDSSTITDLTKFKLTDYSDPWRMFVIKAYKIDPSYVPSSGLDIHPYLIPITLPTTNYHVIGAANSPIDNANYKTTRTAQQCSHIVPGKDLKFEGCTAYFYGPTGIAGKTNYDMAYSNFGSANINSINSDTTTGVRMIEGMFDSRLGRGIAPVTFDLDALKKVMEVSPSSVLSSTDLQFRTDFDPTATLTSGTLTKYQWNGLVYIEFPTSLTLNLSAGVNNKNSINSLRFSYATAGELRHPDRWDSVDNYKRANRTDNVIPLAPELRQYPTATSANLNTTILNACYVIPAVQLINGRELPHPNKSTLRGSTEGFSIATNAPLYLVGTYNSDGNYKTGTNVTATAPCSWATSDAPVVDEIPAAIFCDTFTVLSDGWGELAGNYKSNRENSFFGANSGSTATYGCAASLTDGTIAKPPGRPNQPRTADTVSKYSSTPTSDPNHTALYPASYTVTSGTKKLYYVEISACIATGEYPIFEFFTHALESYNAEYGAITNVNPIIFKGSLVSMYHSEIQHIKQAYGRDVNQNIQVYYTQHGAFAIAGARYHQFLVNGVFPPGTPKAYLTMPKGYKLLATSTDPNDQATLKSAGF